MGSNYLIIIVMGKTPSMENLVRQQFQDGTLTPRSPLSALPWIGPYFSARLQANHLNTVSQFVRSFHNLNITQTRDRLTSLVQNRRASQCTALSRNSPRAQEFKQENGQHRSSPHYMIRDVNHQAFLILRALLVYARQNPTLWGRRRVVIGRLPALPPARAAEASFCPCFTTRRECDKWDQSCLWLAGRGGGRGSCNPLNDHVGFEGVANYKGQTDSRRRLLRPGADYVAGWRRSGPLPALPVL